MDKYTKLSPEMQQKYDEEMKRIKDELDEIDCKQEFKQLYGFEMDRIADYSFEMEYLNCYYDTTSLQEFADEYDKQLNELYSSINKQITSIKSQLKHCKNPLQKLNMEREMNRLIREKNRR